MPEKFSIVNASGRKVNLLSNDFEPYSSSPPTVNEHHPVAHHIQHHNMMARHSTGSASSLKDRKPPKKHVCGYPGCGRAFSTSGHLARHHRIHTGEKNFRCLLPQCSSRFSRQDNMMQHFRTHFLAKSKPSKLRMFPHHQQQNLVPLTYPPPPPSYSNFSYNLPPIVNANKSPSNTSPISRTSNRFASRHHHYNHHSSPPHHYHPYHLDDSAIIGSANLPSPHSPSLPPILSSASSTCLRRP